MIVPTFALAANAAAISAAKTSSVEPCIFCSGASKGQIQNTQVKSLQLFATKRHQELDFTIQTQSAVMINLATSSFKQVGSEKKKTLELESES